MKKELVTFAFAFSLVLVLFFSACEEKQTSHELNTKAQTVATLDELARAMATDNQWLTSDVKNSLALSSVKISDIPVLNKFKPVIAKSNGLDQDITIEIEGRCAPGLAKSLSGQAYRVALDPDQNYFPENIDESDLREMPDIELPTYLFDGVSTTPVEETITLGPKTVLSEPLYYIVLKDQQKVELGKASATPGVYITFISANLRKKNDSGNEEFEINYSDGPSVTNDAFNVLAAYQFNGVSRADASGEIRLFPDINTTTNYVAQQPISMRKLDGLGAPSAWRWISMEDDVDAGEFYYSQLWNGTKPVDYYDMSDNYLKPNLTSTFHFTPFFQGFDLDDIYTKTGVMNINQNNLNLRLGGGQYKDTDDNYSGTVLGDINWRVGQVTY